MKYLLIILLSTLMVGCIKPQDYKFTIVVVYNGYSKSDTITSVATKENDFYIYRENLYNSWQGDIASGVRTFKIINKQKQ